MKLAAALLVMAAPLPAIAQQRPVAPAVDPALRARADELVTILSGGGDYAAFSSAAFRQAVPREQFDGIGKGLVAALGPVRRIESLTPVGAWSATLVIGFERGTANAELALDPATPHVVIGLRITGTQLRNDSFARIEAEVKALPGTAALGVYELGPGAPRPLLAIRDADPMPLASSFKLWVLAELSRQVKAGQRRWTDVVPVGPPSLPSGVLQNWPPRSPVTLQTLATQMISISDNTATDTLMGVLGRSRLDASAAASGLSTPVLTTREAFVLKSDAALRAAWAAASGPRKAAQLASRGAEIAARRLDPTMFSHGSIATDTVEWFARPADTAHLLDRFRKGRDATTLAILAVNHGADPLTIARFSYLGFKGGSEPGVLTLNFLARTKDNRWFAVTGAWHNPTGSTDEMQFLTLTTRALALISQDKP